MTSQEVTLFFAWNLLRAQREARKNAARYTRWVRENPAKRRAIACRYSRKKFKQDPYFRVTSALYCRVRSALRARKAHKSSKTVNLLGCSIPELRSHLESIFQPGMSWKNYGDWHIDHKKPCASFDLSDPEQQKVCFHYSNLQPLWALDNLSKGAACQ